MDESAQMATRALEIASQVEARLKVHEDHCFERSQQYRADVMKFREKLDDNNRQSSERTAQIYHCMEEIRRDIGNFKVGGLVSIIMLMGSILGYILINGVPWAG